MTTTLYLVRHAEAEGNLYRRIHGWYDSPVTGNGMLQIQALEARFAELDVDALYASPLRRTVTTAKAIAGPKGLELRLDADLREVHMGDWEDQPWGLAYHADRESMALFNQSSPAWQAPNGESLAQGGARMERALARILAAHPGQRVAVVSHGTVIRQVLANIQGLTPEQWHTLHHSDNTAVSCVRFEDGRASVVFQGDNSHLDPSISTLARQGWWRKDRSIQDVNLWFRPLDWPEEQPLYLAARQEAWRSTHGPGPAFDGEGFLADANAHQRQSPWAVCAAMAGDEVAGIVQLDTGRYAADNAGYLAFCYLTPQRRCQGLGVQLIGQAVSYFRNLGRDKLRLRCAPYNEQAQHIYLKDGFVKVGEEQGSRVPLDILEKYIG